MKPIKPIQPLMYAQSQYEVAMRFMLSIVFSILTGFALGFVAGAYYQHNQEFDDKIIKLHAAKSKQYTVLDANRVINSDGDTIVYQWNKQK